MSYDHYASTQVQLKDGITVDQIAAALVPIIDYFGIDFKERLNSKDSGNIEFTLVNSDLYVYTSGDVSCGFSDLIEQCAVNLGPLTEGASRFELVDSDCPNPDEATTYFKYGESEQTIKDMRFRDALIMVEESLKEFVPAAYLQKLKHELAAVRTKGDQPADTIPVTFWDSTQYGGSTPETDLDFAITITDQRTSNGQLFVDVEGDTSNPDDLLSCSFEINKLPGSKTPTQCVHLHFDGDNLAMSIFKQADKYILRPEQDVRLHDTVLPNGEHGWIIS